KITAIQAKSASEHPGDLFGIVGDNHWAIGECGLDPHSTRRFELPGVIAIDVIRILEHIAGEHGDYIRIRSDYARCRKLPNSRQRRRRSRLTSDSAQSNNGFCVGDLLLCHLLHYAA